MITIQTWNFLDYLYHQNYYKLIGINLSRQTSTSIPQQINFVEKLEEDDGAKMFFYCWNAAKKYSKIFFKLFQNNINNGTTKNIKFIKWSKQF